MKKISTILVLFLLNLGFLAAQTIVSTEVENKKVILEEYTGIHCGHCPEGHEIAKSIVDSNFGNAFVINIHTGSFAVPTTGEPDFRTSFGPLFRAQAGISGFPAATVNRHVFEGFSQNIGTGMSRNHWVAATDTVLKETSYVNMAMKAEIDYANRELTVLAEVYYTGNSPETINFLHIALLQDNTYGYQNYGGSNYNHSDRLVWMLTGSWGDVINTTKKDNFFSKTYTYTIPEDYNDIDAILSDMKLVGFISETKQEIQSGNMCIPSYKNFPYNDVLLEKIEIPHNVCSNALSPVVNVQNKTATNLTEIEFEYSVNGEAVQSYTWKGSISTFETKAIELQEIVFQPASSYSIDIEIIYSDTDQTNNRSSSKFYPAPEGNKHIFLDLFTDNAGEQCTWDIRDASGNILQSGGPYAANENIKVDFTITPGCNSFNIYDSGGNGGGSVTLTDSEGKQLYYSIGDYGEGASQLFKTTSSASVSNTDKSILLIYPNPATKTVSITSYDQTNLHSVFIYDVLGNYIKEIPLSNLQETTDIDVADFPRGLYFFRFSNGMLEKVMIK
jgi:hypothetical protein